MKETTRISFEYFPPRDAAQAERFQRTFDTLAELQPAYASITWGALGSDSRASLDMLEKLSGQDRVPLTAHLSCSGQSAEQLRVTLDILEGFGIGRILALRGDQGAPPTGGRDVFRHASQLVTLIANERPHLDVSVAAYPEVHPEAENATFDLHWLKHKLDCGASRAVTQFFFEADAFLRFRDRARSIGIEQSLVPGILPVHDIAGVQRFASRCGATVPRALLRRFEGAADDGSRHALAVEHAVALCRRLEKEGVRDFHLYTLNRVPLSKAVVLELCGGEIATAAA